MRNKIYPWIILLAVLSAGILYVHQQPYLYKKARAAIEELDWQLQIIMVEVMVRSGYGHGCGGF